MTKKGKRRRGKRTSAPARKRQFTGAEKVMILDCLERSGLTVTDFAGVCGVSRETLYTWRRRFEQDGPAGLEHKPRRPRGSQLPIETQRAILLLKQTHPEWGCQRIHDMLLRSEGFTASPGAIMRVLTEAGYVVEEAPARRHPDKKRRFERARPNQLWQSDLFTFTLKRANRRVHLVGFLDDQSRFVTGHALAASASGSMVKEALLTGVARHGQPEELLTDNGPPYASWRGKTGFTRLLTARGIKHVRSRPRHPQTLGKIERFWQSLWQECLVDATLRDLEEARSLIASYIDRYNFLRPHQGIDGLVPADRFFGADSAVRASMQQRAEARLRAPDAPEELYLTGKVGEQTVSLHSAGDKLILVGEGGQRREVSLVDHAEGEPPQPAPQPAPQSAPLPAPQPALQAGSEASTRPVGVERRPGESPLDEVLRDLDTLLGATGGEGE